jgi:hypothetical protein
MMVIMEWLVRGVITWFFRIVPLSYCLDLMGIPQRAPQYTKEDEEMEMDTCEYIESRGFPSESHFVTTPDGYILGLQRIPSKNSFTCADGADGADGADDASN